MVKWFIAIACAAGALVSVCRAEGPGGGGSREQPVAHWKLDGDARDGSGGGHHGEAVGRCQFLASPVGGGGELLALDGVDACVRVGRERAPRVGGDFTLSAWVFPLEMRTAGIVAVGDSSRGWSVDLREEGTIGFDPVQAGRKGVQTLAKRVFAGQWYHVVVVSRAAAGGGRIELYVNGAPVAAGVSEGVAFDGPVVLGRGAGDGELFNGLVDDVRVYDRALDAGKVAQLTDEGLFWLREKGRARSPFAGKFRLEDGDVVVFAGGENTLGAAEAGYLETLLACAFPGRRLICRTMAWEGDTAERQGRMVNFEPWPRQLDRVGAGVVVAQFGKTEALAGRAGVGAFVAAYGKLLDELGTRTRRIVLLSPTPFEPARAPLPDLSVRNDDLRAYVEAIRELAKARECLFVDLFTPMLGKSQSGERLTRDGMHLLPRGQRAMAAEIGRQLGLAAPAGYGEVDGRGGFGRPELERVRLAVRDKNRMWSEYWRPTNWAFLAGDRMSQPSSRDHLDPRVRWFPIEIQEFQALIAAEEAKITELARTAAR